MRYLLTVLSILGLVAFGAPTGALAADEEATEATDVAAPAPAEEGDEMAPTDTDEEGEEAAPAEEHE